MRDMQTAHISHVPETLATVVCGCCGTTAACRSAAILQSVAHDPYCGADVIRASIEFALPDGWAIRDFGSHVWYVCPCHCGADEISDRTGQPALAKTA